MGNREVLQTATLIMAMPAISSMASAAGGPSATKVKAEETKPDQILIKTLRSSTAWTTSSYLAMSLLRVT